MQDLFAVQYSWLIPLLPLIGAAVAGFGGARWLKQRSHWPIWIGVGASALLSLTLLFGMLRLWHGDAKLYTGVTWFTWIEAGKFVAQAGAWIDPLTAVMLCVVTCIGFLITVFAKGYMQGEDGYFRFFAYLGLFIFAMTCLVMGNNFLMLYLGWEGVGVCSYLLIGYYYQRPAAREAAKKAFIVNRVGDFGFALGIMLIFLAFHTITYFDPATGKGALDQAVMPHLSAFQQQALGWIPFLLMLGAFGKSAQFPLHVWLPDAMEGPTPVSALIHAATMVTAGVYMIARCSTMFVGNAAAMWTVAAVGAFTALFAATIALRQFDLKKVFAYSTVSQLGFMFVGVGVLAPVAGVFHLVTHAFFKALLFLSSGVVMHAMMGVLDMRKMSGLRRVLPKTNILMLIGCSALAGVPFLSGFLSKDEIVAAAFRANFGIGLVLLVTAFLTAYYSFRLYFRVFQGPEIIPEPEEGHGHAPDHGAEDQHAHASAAAVQTHDVHESGKDKAAAHHDAGHAHNHEPAVMIWPLIVLAIGAIFAGYINWPQWEHRHTLGAFLSESPSFQKGNFLADQAKQQFPHYDPEGFGFHDVPAHLFTPVMGISAIVAILGIWLAYRMHLRDRRLAERMAARFEPFTGWIEAKYWIDELYQGFIVEPLRAIGRFFFALDRYLIDGLVWTVGFIPQAMGFTLKLTTQRGSLQGYALGMLFGILIILLWVFW